MRFTRWACVATAGWLTVTLAFPSNTFATGRVAILQDDFPAAVANASPDFLAERLRQAGFEVTMVDGRQLGDSNAFHRARFDVVVLPYGPSFPRLAAENFRRFLRAGGKFFSTGGYAFDDLLERTAEGWQRPALPKLPPVRQVVWRYQIPAETLRAQGRLTFSGWLKTQGVRGSGMAYFAVYQYAADGRITTWQDLCKVRGSQEWKEFRYDFHVHPQSATVELHAGLYECGGTAWFDDVQLANAHGHALLSADFESPFDPDIRQPGNWWRSDAQLAEVQTNVRHTGQRALQATLHYFLPADEVLNTRHGRPEDGLEVGPDQLGVFQADYLLERVHVARAAPEQAVLRHDLRIEQPLAGYAACGVTGFDHARWMPLLNGYDRYGRLRGAVGALLRHFAGPYAGSSWAFFGVTNCNLFADAHPAMTEAFVDIVRSLVRDTYVAWLVPGLACNRPGEEARLEALIVNHGRQDAPLRFTLDLYAGEPDVEDAPPARRPEATLSTNFHLPSGQSLTLSLPWQPGRTATDFYFALGHLWADGQEIDRLASGVLVAREWVVAAGPKLNYRDNYLRLGRRPMFLFGTDDWAYVFTTKRETPLQWLRDMRLRRDLGVQIYENLQFGALPPFATEPEDARTRQRLRQLDGVIQLAQKYQQVYFAGLLIGANTAAGDAELERQRAFCRDFAHRYARVPGLIHYLNGDLQCALGDAVSPQWNQFLRERYGRAQRGRMRSAALHSAVSQISNLQGAAPTRSPAESNSAIQQIENLRYESDANTTNPITDEEITACIRAAWRANAPAQPLGQIPVEDFNDWGHPWDDVKIYDLNRFRAWLIRRWHSNLVAAIREFDRTHPTTSEFYQLPHFGVDLPAGIDGLDLGNFGYFDRPGADLARFPAICQYNNQRARRKSGGPGEYGVKTHPAWGDGRDYGYHITRTREQAIELFLGIAHYSLGLGASRIHNWCWKDCAHRVFPWGMIYPCDGVPKDTAYVHRNQSLLFRHFAPVYRAPSVYVLTPDSHRFGGGKWEVIEGVLQCIDLLLDAHVENLGTLNEDYLEIPAAAKVMFWPLPFCPPDDAYARVLRWVQAGGVLYLSGDISYDEFRRRTRTHRLEELCGVRFVAERFPNISLDATNAADQPCIRVEPVTATPLSVAADGAPLVLENQVGRGKVIFTTDPIELHCVAGRRDRDLALYRRVLATGGVKPLGVQPDNPRLHVFRVPLADGGRVWVVFNTDETHPARTVTLTDEPLTLTVARRRPALAWFDGRGRLRGVETQGACRIGTELVLTDETGGIAMTLDGRDLRRSRALLFMPLQPGRIELCQSRPWRNGVITTGEIRNGAWQSYATATPQVASGRLAVSVSPDQVFSLLLVSESSAADRWPRAVERAMTHAASLR